jgi:hypothetical protein
MIIKKTPKNEQHNIKRAIVINNPSMLNITMNKASTKGLLNKS